ncbi:hypothetical protein [Bradyrhizobium sp. SBR1B]|uniref:hypothetical protein n=1 Tax=Bradyrhizobium sp. SBR1B TaxID=2663836 RepID=UPI00160569CE|nr:hypothetical protein [Bradyrhizobium sp. SBR1B]MBB4383250.1 hypothetical protein [Bradyrhizobium sp. SBR1B]
MGRGNPPVLGLSDEILHGALHFSGHHRLLMLGCELLRALHRKDDFAIEQDQPRLVLLLRLEFRIGCRMESFDKRNGARGTSFRPIVMTVMVIPCLWSKEILVYRKWSACCTGTIWNWGGSVGNVRQ